ncbi:MAG: sodium/proline symporter [Clostridia bacterium]|nr:sodium/proline symporter [Clostridia bacterium]
MDSKNIVELVVFIIYLLFMLGIGVYFFIKSKSGGEKTYFLGNRKMGPWVTALSAGASDMSAWVLMGLPTSIYAAGLGQTWIAIGLALGYTLSWIFEASRLRRFSIVANDSITIPQFLTNRFKEKSKALQIICAIVFIIAYTVYAASSIVACGTLFNTVLGVDPTIAKCVAAVVIIGYTFLGGFSAVCWTDFFQGMLILGAMMLVPIFAAAQIDTSTLNSVGGGYWSMFADWKEIVSGLAWGLGYFGMPHIIIRFLSLKSQKDVKKSATIGISWTVLILAFAVAIGIIGRATFGLDDNISSNSLVFIEMVRKIFPTVITGILLSAILAASMSTADSQLLAASSAFASDVYNPVIRKNKASDKEMLWAGRYVVLAVAVAALTIALLPNTGTIMSLVSNAWGVFGAAFGPTIILSLFWKRFNFAGAVAGIVSGAVIDIGWLILGGEGLLGSLGSLYELFPGFVCSLIIAVVVTLATKAPSKEVEELFDKAVNYCDE